MSLVLYGEALNSPLCGFGEIFLQYGNLFKIGLLHAGSGCANMLTDFGIL